MTKKWRERNVKNGKWKGGGVKLGLVTLNVLFYLQQFLFS